MSETPLDLLTEALRGHVPDETADVAAALAATPAGARLLALAEVGAAALSLTEEALRRFDQHGSWTGAMATFTPTYGGGWTVTIEYPEADYGNHLGFGSGDTLEAAATAAFAEAEATIAAAALEPRP